MSDGHADRAVEVGAVGDQPVRVGQASAEVEAQHAALEILSGIEALAVRGQANDVVRVPIFGGGGHLTARWVDLVNDPVCVASQPEPPRAKRHEARTEPPDGLRHVADFRPVLARNQLCDVLVSTVEADVNIPGVTDSQSTWLAAGGALHQLAPTTCAEVKLHYVVAVVTGHEHPRGGTLRVDAKNGQKNGQLDNGCHEAGLMWRDFIPLPQRGKLFAAKGRRGHREDIPALLAAGTGFHLSPMLLSSQSPTRCEPRGHELAGSETGAPSQTQLGDELHRHTSKKQGRHMAGLAWE